jgi:hypothetical protein
MLPLKELSMVDNMKPKKKSSYMGVEGMNNPFEDSETEDKSESFSIQQGIDETKQNFKEIEKDLKPIIKNIRKGGRKLFGFIKKEIKKRRGEKKNEKEQETRDEGKAQNFFIAS